MLVLAVAVTLVGCAGAPPRATNASTGVSPTAAGTIAVTTSPRTPAAPPNATDRVVAAETDRIHAALTNALGVENPSVGVYSDPSAAVVERDDDGVTVRVTVPYSYEYDCSDRSGAVDGAESRATYRATDGAVRLTRVAEAVSTPCGG